MFVPEACWSYITVQYINVCMYVYVSIYIFYHVYILTSNSFLLRVKAIWVLTIIVLPLFEHLVSIEICVHASLRLSGIVSNKKSEPKGEVGCNLSDLWFMVWLQFLHPAEVWLHQSAYCELFFSSSWLWSRSKIQLDLLLVKMKPTLARTGTHTAAGRRSGTHSHKYTDWEIKWRIALLVNWAVSLPAAWQLFNVIYPLQENNIDIHKCTQ